MNLSYVFFNGGDLTFQNFSGSRFFRTQWQGADLSHANLTNCSVSTTSWSGATLYGVDTRGYGGSSLGGADVTNLIWPSGHMLGLILGEVDFLFIRDYDGDPDRDVAPIPIRVEDHLAMSGTGTLYMIFEADEWNSTISFDPGIPVDLGGILDLNFKEDVNITSQIGRTLDLFDWTGVSPTGAFAVESPYSWDLTNLYTTGEVTLLSASSLPGDFDGDGDVDGRDLLAWQRDPGIGSLTAWRANYGDSVAGLSAFEAVPEPSGAVLALAACLLATRRLRSIAYPHFDRSSVTRPANDVKMLVVAIALTASFFGAEGTS